MIPIARASTGLALGGFTALEHSNFQAHGPSYLAHEIQIEPQSLLAEIIGDEKAMVNSLHHQGVLEVGAGYRVVAKAPDGIIEAMELEEHPFGLAVQWHPEWMSEAVEMQAVFKAFVEASNNSEGNQVTS